MAVDLDDYVDRSQQALPLSAHVVFRPLHEQEVAKRKDSLSLRKLSGEGRPEESKNILGWVINTRTFRIHLSKDKHTRWINDINILLQKNTKFRAKQVECTIGRLNHVGHILPQTRYFLNRLRLFHSRCQKYGPQTAPPSVRQDLLL